MDHCEVCGVVLEDEPARCVDHAYTDDSDVEYWAHGGPYPSVMEQIVPLLAEASEIVDMSVRGLDYDSEVYTPTDNEELELIRFQELKRCLDGIKKLLAKSK
jgi:hypothetical protein